MVAVVDGAAGVSGVLPDGVDAEEAGVAVVLGGDEAAALAAARETAKGTL